MVSSKSLNEDKTRFTFFHKLQDRDKLSLQLPVLKINNYEIKRSSSITFLRVIVVEHLNWKDHINVIENKLSKNLGLLHKAKQFLNAKAMKSLYFSFIHSYLTYGNVWCSTSMNKTKKLFSKQKQAIKIIPMTDIHANLNSDEEPNILLRVTKFAVSSRGPCIWNKHTDKLLKTTNSLSLFKAKIKDRLIKLKKISIYFQ